LGATLRFASFTARFKGQPFSRFALLIPTNTSLSPLKIRQKGVIKRAGEYFPAQFVSAKGMIILIFTHMNLRSSEIL